MTRSPRARAFARDRSGLALIEFAYATPVLLLLGFLGSSVADLATTNMKLSQVTLTAADNGSRLGEANTLSVRQLREQDINDVFDAADRQARGMELFKNGRMIISSVQQDDKGRQTIAWQRCRGLRAGDASAFGKPGDKQNDKKKALAEFERRDQRVMAQQDGAVIVVESFYDYQPITKVKWAAQGDRTLASDAFFTVRDRRDLSGVFNPDPKAKVYDCKDLTP